ncbi:MAG: DUF167 domain-containing protein [Candidatus Aenigmatarchaeota archaeon]
MRIVIKVVPGAHEDGVREERGVLVVRTKSPAEKGQANAAVLKLLEEHFGHPVRLVAGASSRRKVVEVG